VGRGAPCFKGMMEVTGAFGNVCVDPPDFKTRHVWGNVTYGRRPKFVSGIPAR
jgi:hypothetical protein